MSRVPDPKQDIDGPRDELEPGEVIEAVSLVTRGRRQRA